MSRAVLLVALTLSGCIIGQRNPRATYQGPGVTLTLAVRDDEGRGLLAGELLAVEPSAFLIDAVDEFGQRIRVVRVPLRAVERGAALHGPISPVDIRSVVDTPYGMRRIATLRAGGRTRSVDLRLLSRFPDGIPPDALARLLDARVQTEVAGLGFAPLRTLYR